MSGIASSKPSRRSLLASAAAFVFVGAAPVRARTLTAVLPSEPGTATPPVLVRPGPWMFFTADEAAMIEAAVDLGKCSRIGLSGFSGGRACVAGQVSLKSQSLAPGAA